MASTCLRLRMMALYMDTSSSRLKETEVPREIMALASSVGPGLDIRPTCRHDCGYTGSTEILASAFRKILILW